MFAFAWVVFIYYYSTHAVTTPAPTDIHKHARTHAHTHTLGCLLCLAWRGCRLLFVGACDGREKGLHDEAAAAACSPFPSTHDAQRLTPSPSLLLTHTEESVAPAAA